MRISFNLLIILLFFFFKETRNIVFEPPFFYIRLKSHVMLLIETKRIFASLECRT